MSTNCAIIKKYDDNTYKQIYCHYDGYPSGVGKTLEYYYQDEDKIDKLINLGDISSLDKEVDIPFGKEHSYNHPLDGVTVAYGRDRGESKVQPRIFNNLSGHEKHNYVYLREDGIWKMRGLSGWEPISNFI